MRELRGRVVVVDDDVDSRRSTGRFLRAAGYTVETHDHPTPLLLRTATDEPTCIVLDVWMSGISGLDIQARLAQLDDAPPLIFVTATADVTACASAFKRGAIDFLLKPFDKDQLLDAIERSLREHNRRRQVTAERRNTRDRVALLTHRERQVCELLMKGLINKQIAWDLGIAESTVKVHRSRMMEKLGIQSIVALVHFLDRGLGCSAWRAESASRHSTKVHLEPPRDRSQCGLGG